MQKFTVFSIILSISLLLVISDMVIHDYLKKGPPELGATPDLVAETGATNVLATLIPEEDLDSQTVFEASELPELVPVLSSALLGSAGFSEPNLKEALYTGMVFNFIPFSDQLDAVIFQSHLFAGEEFMGTAYEMIYPSETASFQAYMSLRSRAEALTDLGKVNEVNNYSDASFYFNHNLKTKTVHLVIRSGMSLYAFEYAHVHHPRMVKLFDLL